MKTRLLFCSLIMLLAISQAHAGLFSNKGILTNTIDCSITGNTEYELLLAKLHVDIWYGHNDVDLFHPTVALSYDASRKIQLDVTTNGSTHRVKIPALNIAIPKNCPDAEYAEETLRKVTFELKLYFQDKAGNFEQVRIMPKTMSTKDQIKFARSKKLTKKLSALFSAVTADLVNNEFTIASPKDGAIFPELIKDSEVLAELEQIAKAKKLHK